MPMRTDRNVLVNFTNNPKICSCGPNRTKVRFRPSFQINSHMFRDSTDFRLDDMRPELAFRPKRFN